MANGGQPLHRDVWAIVPIKEIVFAKQRLAKALSPARRQELAVAMFEDVMQALSASSRPRRHRGCHFGSKRHANCRAPGS